jgi:uncharacterized protein (UPF0210 family)
MLVGRLICSDPGCAAEVVAEAATLRELETLACACGCGLELIAWPDCVAPDRPLAEVVLLRSPGGPLPEAA